MKFNKNSFKILLAISLFIKGFTVQAAELPSQGGKVTLVSSKDGEDFQITLQAAERSETLTNLIEDAGIGNPIPMLNIDGKVLGFTVALLERLNSLLVLNEKLSPEQQVYIPRRFQKHVNLVLHDATNQEVGQVFDAANYLAVPFILNGVASVIADRLSAGSRGIKLKQPTLALEEDMLYRYRFYKFGIPDKHVSDYILKHLLLRKLGITEEFSIADYIATYGQPDTNTTACICDAEGTILGRYLTWTFSLSAMPYGAPDRLKITSLFGIERIQNQEARQGFDFSDHGLSSPSLDPQPQPNPFYGFPNVEYLSIENNALRSYSELGELFGNVQLPRWVRAMIEAEIKKANE